MADQTTTSEQDQAEDVLDVRQTTCCVVGGGRAE